MDPDEFERAYEAGMAPHVDKLWGEIAHLARRPDNGKVEVACAVAFALSTATDLVQRVGCFLREAGENVYLAEVRFEVVRKMANILGSDSLDAALRERETAKAKGE